MRNDVRMNYESIVICIAAVLYFSVGVSYFLKGNYPWAIIWVAYSVANFGLVWAALIPNK
jgi:hypothetical protein